MDTVEDQKKRRQRPLHASPERALQYWVDVVGMKQTDICRAAGIRPPKLNDMLHGRRPFDDQLLDWLGFERVVIYRRKRSPPDA